MAADISRVERSTIGGGAVTPLPVVPRRPGLPVALTSFVGRERELVQLEKAVATTRLLTLTGAGGCGKTRLALELAAELVDRFPDGVWWVDLAPLGDERLLATAVAQALGVRPLPGLTELQACGAFFASRRALLVLDNCEHLMPGCAEAVESLLRAAPALVVLATSRAPLGVAGETDWRVPSLSLPRSGADRSSDAMELFVQRARKLRPDFALNDSNAEWVARIVTGVDGLPLAIELAAARLRLLSLQQIAAGLSDRFRLLTGGPRTVLARHQTLRACLDWSHALLSQSERALFRRLAVFVGGFTLEAVEHVCAGDGVERRDLLDLLGSLVDRSLVTAEHREGGARYRLLETMREYALERLAEADEDEPLRGRHRDFFLALVEQADPHLHTGRQPEWLNRLDPEAANLAAAIEYALASEPRLALRFCAALYRWWWIRGRLAEAELAHARSLHGCDDREPALRGRVLHGRAWVAVFRGEFEAGQSYATESLALAEEVGDRAIAARARCALGDALVYANPPAARAELSRAAHLARAAGDAWALVQAKQVMAMAAIYQGDHALAAASNDEVAALAEQLGEPYLVARRWFLASTIAQLDGRFAEARDAAYRMRLAAEAVGDRVMEAWTDYELGMIDVWQGHFEGALERLHRQLVLSLKIGFAGAPWLLTAIAHAELGSGQLEQARGRLEGVLAVVQGRDAFITSWALGVLANVLRLLTDGEAERTACRAQTVGEQLGNPLLASHARLTLGRLAATRGDWAAAHQHVLAHLDACVEGGHATFVPGCLDALAEVAAGLGSDADAVRLFAAAERARGEIGVVRIPGEEVHWTTIQSRLGDALGDDAYEAARAQGAGLTIHEALEWARRARGPRRRPPGGWQSLTPTEQRVAELVAEGLTNREIGERMFIAPETVKTHLAHIYSKLGVNNRAQLTAQAIRRPAAT